MNVPFLDVGATYRELQPELDGAFRRVMESGRFILGDEVQAFEDAFARSCDATHCVGVANGLDALHLILRASGIGPGDEVLVPANTFVATWLAVSYAGARPVPVEPDPATCNMSPATLEASITPKTAAVMPVHLYGQPADMDPIIEIGRKHHLLVVEDAAQAHGARYKGRPAGGLSGAAGFSFYPGKNLGAYGDGGAVVTDDAVLAEKVRALANYGSRSKYDHQLAGFNSRLDELQAAFLRVRLAHLPDWNARRCTLAAHYLKGLAGLPDLTLPSVPSWAEPSWHIFAIRHPQRDRLQEHLTQAGIGTLIHYPIPPHLSGAYADSGWKAGDFPISEELSRTQLSLPMGPHVSEEQAQVVIDQVRIALQAIAA